MQPAGARNSFVLPPALLAEVEAVAADDHRPVADVARDLVAQGLSGRRRKAQGDQELRRARELGLPNA